MYDQSVPDDGSYAVRLWDANQRSAIFYDYNKNASEYYVGHENKFAVYATHDWNLLPVLNLYYGARLEWQTLSGRNAAVKNSAGDYVGRFTNYYIGATAPDGTRISPTRIDYHWFNYDLTAAVTYKLTKEFGFTGDFTYLVQHPKFEAFAPATLPNTGYYRPIYHHTPSYGWMNDANGMVYKDGVCHLYFQYNPYGSKWGNMHWGHAVSSDLMHWRELPPAIARDTLGHIFSSSSVIDVNNSTGYGKNAIIAFYTSASDKNGQIQCMAYSLDNGTTFTKYNHNPVLRPFDGLKDFRDPKVFWYAPAKNWYMIVSADKEMRFYKSQNLKDWTYVSAFGRGYGAQPNQFECPDFFPLTVNGKTKYVMIVNINPGCLFGGSATEYFVDDFDGTHFTCDTPPSFVKWLDYGKDHYATVTFYGTPGRVVALPWMSNWQYANVTPIRQYRGANGLPRELSQIYLDMSKMRLVMDRTRSGLTSFGSKSSIHEIEKEADVNEYREMKIPARAANSVNYQNDFALGTWAPLSLCNGKTYHLDIFVDKCSVEIFVDGGRIAMTNLVFPTQPYNNIKLYSKGGTAKVMNLKIYKLGM